MSAAQAVWLIKNPLEGTYLYPSFDANKKHLEVRKLFHLDFTPLPNSLYFEIDFGDWLIVPDGFPEYPESDSKPKVTMISTRNTSHKIGYMLTSIVGIPGADKTRPVLMISGYRVTQPMGLLTLEPALTCFRYYSDSVNTEEWGALHPVGRWPAISIDPDALAATLLFHKAATDVDPRRIAKRLNRIEQTQQHQAWLTEHRETFERLYRSPGQLRGPGKPLHQVFLDKD